jgi:murein DD-endopeptidase MepM/ murein hydrolase activator NlpD
MLLLLLVAALPIALVAGGGAGSAAPPPGSGIPSVYMQIYAAGERTYGVNRFLLASIHFQETRFSTLRTRSLVGNAVTGGWNVCGAAGPMQMGIVGVAPYRATTAGGCSAGATWLAHRLAFRRAARWRPADYPLHREELAGCFAVPLSQGCVYDDFDGILGAAHKLHHDGADLNLDSAGTRQAVCAYIGACAAADTYYAVIPRAKEWQAVAEAGQPLGFQEGVGPRGLIWPVVGPVVSPYGLRWGRMHEGVDIAAPAGTPILAAADGQVVLGEWFGGYGQFTCLRHAAALTTCYAHQSATLVRRHQLVRRGQRIGLVGCTGHCFGPHLHFEVHLAQTWSAHERDIDPLEALPRR